MTAKQMNLEMVKAKLAEAKPAQKRKPVKRQDALVRIKPDEWKLAVDGMSYSSHRRCLYWRSERGRPETYKARCLGKLRELWGEPDAGYSQHEWDHSSFSYCFLFKGVPVRLYEHDGNSRGLTILVNLNATDEKGHEISEKLFSSLMRTFSARMNGVAGKRTRLKLQGRVYEYFPLSDNTNMYVESDTHGDGEYIRESEITYG